MGGGGEVLMFSVFNLSGARRDWASKKIIWASAA